MFSSFTYQPIAFVKCSFGIPLTRIETFRCFVLKQTRAGTGLKFLGSGRTRVVSFGLKSGSGLGILDFLILLHKKSGLGNFRVSCLEGLGQKSGPGFGLM